MFAAKMLHSLLLHEKCAVGHMALLLSTDCWLLQTGSFVGAFVHESYLKQNRTLPILL